MFRYMEWCSPTTGFLTSELLAALLAPLLSGCRCSDIQAFFDVFEIRAHNTFSSKAMRAQARRIETMRSHAHSRKWVIAGLVTAVSLLSVPWNASAAGQLVVNLPLDQTNGTTAPDRSGNGNNGTLQNGASWTTGRLNRAVSFDGIDDTILIADTPSLDQPSTGITVSAWIYRGTNENRWVGVVSRQV